MKILHAKVDARAEPQVFIRDAFWYEMPVQLTFKLPTPTASLKVDSIVSVNFDRVGLATILFMCVIFTVYLFHLLSVLIDVLDSIVHI